MSKLLLITAIDMTTEYNIIKILMLQFQYLYIRICTFLIVCKVVYMLKLHFRCNNIVCFSVCANISKCICGRMTLFVKKHMR